MRPTALARGTSAGAAKASADRVGVSVAALVSNPAPVVAAESEQESCLLLAGASLGFEDGWSGLGAGAAEQAVISVRTRLVVDALQSRRTLSFFS